MLSKNSGSVRTQTHTPHQSLKWSGSIKYNGAPSKGRIYIKRKLPFSAPSTCWQCCAGSRDDLTQQLWPMYQEKDLPLSFGNWSPKLNLQTHISWMLCYRFYTFQCCYAEGGDSLRMAPFLVWAPTVNKSTFPFDTFRVIFLSMHISRRTQSQAVMAGL